MPSPKEIRQNISQQIVDALKSGNTLPWRQPWSNDLNVGLPRNAVSANRYSGVNPILLEISRMRQGFQSKWWGTYKQIQQLGANVKRGEKGTAITFYKNIPVKNQKTTAGEEPEKTVPLLRTYHVFNVEQTDGLDHLRIGHGDSTTDMEDSHDEADELIDATEADIRYGGNRAFYSPTTDHIQLPMRNQFPDMNEFYSTATHELVHWSGASHRLNRFGLSYAFEELVAEIGSCYTCCEVGVPASDDLSDVTSYVQSWLRAMENDPSFIFKAASHASKAADYLLDFRPSPVEEPALVV
ncbi:ArdC family protein [Gimesia chilikensis]|uniref:DNA primase TraC n=1 Tax=Gimesia chilikensis TaxID=2605989 RepID=A0A517PYB8_9PLAN|nr:zincin-like metallopeptidase domain-containing protein [Gimesia chilikensis]QDT24380.1 DNA primase TraC [Gimesia chilikensis]